MFDKALVLEILIQIEKACQVVIERFVPIKQVDDFTNSPAGKEKLDSICMQLIAIGESLKNVDKITASQLLVNYPQVDWRGAKGMRDIISHHYFDIDAEEIFFVCNNKIKEMQQVVLKIISDLNS